MDEKKNQEQIPEGSAPGKKYRKILIAVIAAAAVLSVGALAYVKMTARDPKEVVIEAFENVFPKDQIYPMDEIFGLKEMAEASARTDSQGGVTLKLDSCSEEMINAYAGSGFRIAGRNDVTNGKADVNLCAVYSGMDLLNLNFYYGDKTLMCTVPELSGKVFSLDLGDGLAERVENSPLLGPVVKEQGVDAAGVISFYADLLEEARQNAQEGKASFDVKALWNRYKEGCRAQENFKAALTVEKGDKAIFTMDGKEVKARAYSVLISKASMIDFLRTSSDFFLQDETLKADFIKQLETAVKMSGLMGGDPFDGMTAEEKQQQTYDQAKEAADEMISYLEEALNDVQMNVYVDKEGRLCAFDAVTQITVKDEETQEGEEKAAGEDEAVYVQIECRFEGGAYLTQNMSLSVDITDEDESVGLELHRQGIYDGKQLTCDISADLTSSQEGADGSLMYTGAYNLENGDYHLTLEASGNGEKVLAVSASGAVDQLERGKSCHINMDELKLTAADDTENIVLSGECYWKPLEEEILPPEGEAMDVLAATEDDWNGVMMEMVFGAMGLAGQLQTPGQ